MVTLCLTSWGTGKLFSKWLRHFIILPSVYEDSNFSTSLPTLVIVCFFILGILVSMKWYLIVVLICISLMTKMLSIFSCLFAICVYIMKCLFKSHTHFLTGLFVELHEILMDCEYKSLIEIWSAVFSCLVVYLFISLMVCFEVWRF